MINKDLINKLIYLRQMFLNSFDSKKFNCPSCGNPKNKVLERKFFITTLRRCQNCYLMYRAPTLNEKESNKFYQKSYSQGFTSDFPSDEKLNELLKTNFETTDRSYKKYLDILGNLYDEKNLNLFDFGCSWGYGSYQLKKRGYDVKAFEVSNIRANFAKTKLNINVIDDLNTLEKDQFDIFFSAHVLEHLPNINKIISLALKILKRGGFFVAITPNGSMIHKKNNKNWNKLWGHVHPNFLDEIFYENLFKDFEYYISSSPYHQNLIESNSNIKKIFEKQNSKYCRNLEHDELLIIVRKK